MEILESKEILEPKEILKPQVYSGYHFIFGNPKEILDPKGSSGYHLKLRSCRSAIIDKFFKRIVVLHYSYWRLMNDNCKSHLFLFVHNFLFEKGMI